MDVTVIQETLGYGRHNYIGNTWLWTSYDIGSTWLWTSDRKHLAMDVTIIQETLGYGRHNFIGNTWLWTLLLYRKHLAVDVI